MIAEKEKDFEFEESKQYQKLKIDKDHLDRLMKMQEF